MTDWHHGTSGGISYIARPGSGPTLVFLHGIGSNATSFAPLFDMMPEHLNLLAWNAPGYLESDLVENSWPVPSDYALKLVQLLDGLGLSTVHLVGHSLGTLIASSFALQFPERLETLVLASAANGYCVEPGSEIPAKAANRITELNRLGTKEFAKSRAGNLVHDPQNNQTVVSRVEASMAQVDPAGYAQAVHLLASGDLPEDLAQVPICPGFIIGTEDKVTPMEQTRTSARAWALQNARNPPVHEIAGAGHAVYLQKPKEFCTALLELLPKSCRPNTATTLKYEEV